MTAGRNGHDPAQQPVCESTHAYAEAVDFDGHSRNERQQPPITDTLQLLLRQFNELKEYFWYYLSAKADGARLSLRNALFGMAFAALAFVAIASLCVAAIWFVLNGTAEGLAILFGNRPWAGSLVTGLLLVGGLGAGTYCIVIRLKKTAREGTVAKYENRQSRQQVRYGHNVAGRAAAHDSAEQK